MKRQPAKEVPVFFGSTHVVPLRSKSTSSKSQFSKRDWHPSLFLVLWASFTSPLVYTVNCPEMTTLLTHPKQGCGLWRRLGKSLPLRTMFSSVVMSCKTFAIIGTWIFCSNLYMQCQQPLQFPPPWHSPIPSIPDGALCTSTATRTENLRVLWWAWAFQPQPDLWYTQGRQEWHCTKATECSLEPE